MGNLSVREVAGVGFDFELLDGSRASHETPPLLSRNHHLLIIRIRIFIRITFVRTVGIVFTGSMFLPVAFAFVALIVRRNGERVILRKSPVFVIAFVAVATASRPILLSSALLQEPLLGQLFQRVPWVLIDTRLPALVHLGDLCRHL